jgi:hypothetical protein
MLEFFERKSCRKQESEVDPAKAGYGGFENTSLTRHQSPVNFSFVPLRLCETHSLTTN